MENQPKVNDNLTINNQLNIFENEISIEKLEERLETLETCANMML